MTDSPSDPVLPIVIVPLQGGKVEEPRLTAPPDLRHWQIEEFLRQTGKADNTQRTYRGQLVRFAAWCPQSWLDVTPSDIGNYHYLKNDKLDAPPSTTSQQHERKLAKKKDTIWSLPLQQ